MNTRAANLALAADEVKDAIKGKRLVLDKDLKAAIKKLSEALTTFRKGRTKKEEKYFNQAKAEWHKDGEVEIDDDAVVSVSDDDGAYVEAWVWVSDITSSPFLKLGKS